jgi:ABC-type multidrug transport system fused ATPase/permease subunit
MHHGHYDQSEFTVANMSAAFNNALRVFRLVWHTGPLLTTLLLTLTIVSAFTPAATAWLLGAVLTAVEDTLRAGDKDFSQVALLILIQAAVVLLSFLLRAGRSATSAILGDLFTNRTNLMILEKSETLDISYFENSAFYDRLENAQREAREGPMQIISESFAVLQNAITLITLIVVLFTISWWIVIVVIITTLPALIVEIKYSRERFRVQTWRSPELRRLGYLRWLITNDDYIKELRIFNLGEYLIGIYRSTFTKFFDENRSLTLRSTRATALLQSAGAIASGGVFVFIAYQVVLGVLRIGALGTYYIAYQQTVDASNQLLQGITRIYERGLFVNNFFEFLEFKPLIESRVTGRQIPRPIKHGIVFDDVHFSYPGTSTPVLRGLSLHIEPGQTIAVVGPNGAGKTTLVKLISQFYEPDSGSIFIDGININEYDVQDLRTQIGVIFQDYGRYQESAKTNIGYGSLPHLQDDKRIAQAAIRSGADEVIQRLDHGYDTQLGRWFRGGVNLSIGQWQKIALARGFMREAQLLILDEPTSSLDVQSEDDVFNRFRELTKNRMAILISHRFTTVRMADQILVIDGGQIIEQGTHDALVKAKGQYAQLFEMQARAYR